jgi:protein-tyrosine phosphatase
MINSILVVCIGNICRSPIGEHLLRNQLKGISVASAGLSALVGRGADPNAISASADHGIDLTHHRAQQFNATMANSSDLILVMDRAQKRQIVNYLPSVSGRIFMLGESEGIDIADPFKKSISDFYDSFDVIHRCTNSWISKISAIQRQNGNKNER